MSKKDFILTGGRVIDPARGIDEVMDIAVSDGVIVDPSSLEDPETIDLPGMVVTPGLIDIHVHLRQPGQTHKETIRTGTMAAAAGGFTSIVAMPNTSPGADTPGTIEYIRKHTEHEGVVKVLPCGAMTKGGKGEEMAGIGSLKKSGIVAVSDDGKCIQNHEIMRHVVEYSRTFELPILDHCEDEYLMSNGVMHEGKWSVLLGMKGIPSEAEELMVARDIMLARKIDWKIHVQHISARESVERIRHARSRGVKITAEVTPHHITLTDEKIKHFDTNFKMNPPLRSEDDRVSLIEGLKDGTITVIATDHAPHTETEKMVEFDYAPFGIVGLETAIPICFTELYHKGILSLSELIAKFTSGPAEVLGMDIGNLAEGKTADITIIDPDATFTIDSEDFFSKSKNTPFNGTQVTGKVMGTIVDGEFVYNLLD